MSNNLSIQILTKDLVYAVNAASSIIDKKPAKQILSNIKLEAKNSKLYVKAVSNDMNIHLEIPTQIENEGSTTVNHLTFAEIIRKIPDEYLSLKCIGTSDEVEVKCANFVSHLATLPAEEFPSLDNYINPEVSFFVTTSALLRLINHSEFAISTEEARYNLNGIYLNSLEPNLLNATALDGHRMSTIYEELEGIPNFGIIIHKKTISELSKLLKDANNAESKVKISFDSNRISCELENIQILAKLVDATYPDFNNFIPKSSVSVLSIHSKTLMNVVDRVAVINQEKFKAIKLIVKQENIEISAYGESRGTAKEIISNNNEIQNFVYDGPPIQIGFNPKYLLDILKNLDNEEIELQFNNAEDPILIKQVSKIHDKYIIMPIKV
ncbi:MAG: DNA polymerase III subunit beta [Rickettsiaceae bacterium]|nr:DNA polymerase III subunit beta [Rickettsiaceae bacterium]